MSLTALFALLGGLLMLAFVANRLFQWTRVPDVVVLMATGLLIGPVLRWVRPEPFEGVAHAFGSLALILILFEAGLDLDLRRTLRHFPGGLLLGFLTYTLTTLAVGGIVWRNLGLPLRDAMTVGAVIGCTSSTIVLPILQQWKAREPVRVTLLVESTLGDILGVLTTQFLLDFDPSQGSAVTGLASRLALQVSISLLSALLIGFLWSKLLPFLSEQRFWQVLTFSMVLLVYAGTEALQGSGLLAVLGFGLALSNLPGARPEMAALFQWAAPQTAKHEQILSFHSELSFLVRTFFFVMIGVVVKMHGLRAIWLLLLGVMGAIWLTRWIGVQLTCWSWRECTPRDRKVVLWMLPRGLITIVLALAVVEARGDAMSFLPPLSFAVVLLTNLLVLVGGIDAARAAPIPAPAPAELGNVPSTGA
jgi:cell volume regulation protein A